MSSGNERPAQRFYSQKLLGLEGPECTIPKCRARGRTISTGWLEFGTLGWWCIEFDCPDHGQLLSTSRRWNPLIQEVLTDHGISAKDATPP